MLSVSCTRNPIINLMNEKNYVRMTKIVQASGSVIYKICINKHFSLLKKIIRRAYSNAVFCVLL